MQSNLFTSSPSVQSSRILYTPSPFARSSLLHLQEVGSLTAIKPHTSKREKLQSYLCFMVEDGEGELVYEGKKYELKAGDVVFIDCRKAYSHSTWEIVLEPMTDKVPIMPTLLKKIIVICGPSVGVISTVHRCQLSMQNTVSVVVCR